MKRTILSLMVYLTVLFIGACSVFWFNTKQSGRMSVRVFAEANHEGFYTLFKVNDSYAVKVYGSEVIGVSTFMEAQNPFCFLCGEYEERGQVLFQPLMQGDWLYSLQQGNNSSIDHVSYPALNIRTGEFITLQSFEEIQLLGLPVDATPSVIHADELNRFDLKILS
ncbi:MAG: hypothetical protein ACKO66_07105, partial [Flavobacteriales bacterium]